jgi:hypothetical protein
VTVKFAGPRPSVPVPIPSPIPLSASLHTMFAPTTIVSTYDQTAIVYRPDTSIEFATIARRPTPPADLIDSLEQGHPVAIRRSKDDAEIQWWPDGLVKIVQADDVELYFWSKPSLRDAMDYRQWNGAQGPGLFKFNSNGSVYGKCFGSTCYWGPTINEYTPEEGEPHVGMQADDGTWTFKGWTDTDDDSHSIDSHRYMECGCRC